MAYKIRMGSRKQELKQPDEFFSLVDRIQHWAVENTGVVTKLILGLVLTGVVVGGFFFFQGSQAEKASVLEFKALQFFQQQGQAFAEADTLSPEENYKKAVKLFQEIIQEFPRTPSAVMARYYLGNAYLKLEEFDSAVKAYQSFLDVEKKNTILRGLVFQRLGYAHLSKNESREAIEAFKAAIELDGILNKDQIYYELGHLFHMMGKNEEAIRNYQAVPEQFPDSLFLSEAQTRLRELGVTEVKPPDAEAKGVSTDGGEESKPEEEESGEISVAPVGIPAPIEPE